MNSDNTCYGIDFGTTNSCISVWYKNEAILIQDFDGSNIIPTVIEITDNKKIIGGEAYRRKEIFEKLTLDNFVIYEIKKLIGKKYSDLSEDQINLLGYNLKPDINDNILIINNEKEYYIDEIITHIFMSFYHFSNKFLSNKFSTELDIKNTIISVPARFNDSQRELIKQCATNAGFEVLRLINEPTAAALCYGIGQNLNEEQNIIVFDFGGGTLDISLLKIFENNYEVVGSSGNSNLGGSDFDRKIMEYSIQKFIETNKLDIEKFLESVTELNLQKLKYLSEKAKISLSDVLQTQIIINNFYEDIPLKVKITRDDLNMMCRDLIGLMIKPLDELLSICEIDKKEINEIVMVGGMTKMPSISNNVELYFGKELNCSIDPDNVVSIGASIYGHLLVNKENIEDRLLLIDRSSLSIGLETSGGIMDILIPRGSIMPVKKIKKYTTDTDDMESIVIKIFEGERKFTKDNFLIGDFILSGIEKTKRGIPEIQITFSIDYNGIIKIKAEDLNNTLNKKSIQITGNKQNLSQEQLDKIIENAKIMDKIDREDKTKKMFHFNLIDDCKKILDNITNEELKIDIDTRNIIIKNINEIVLWLENTKYDDIDIDQYKETIQDFKTKYSIFLIHNNTSTFDIKTANDSEESIGVKIYDNEENIKIYPEQVLYIRNILEEYNNIKTNLNKLYNVEFFIENYNETNDNKTLLDNKEDIIKHLFNLCTSICEFSSNLLTEFFTNILLDDNIVNQYISDLFEKDCNYKKEYELYEECFEILLKIKKIIDIKETIYLEMLENESMDEIYINNKLEILLEYQKILHKIKNKYDGYEEYDILFLKKMLNVLKILNC